MNLMSRMLAEKHEREAQRQARNSARKELNMRVNCTPSKALRRGNYEGGGVSGKAIAKEGVLESPAYENAVRAIGRCMRCGCTCRPQFCHRDEGKGMGIKTDCREGWAGCADCHYFVGTSGKLPKEERRAEDLRLGALTRAELLAAGTWPKSVPMWTEQQGATT